MAPLRSVEAEPARSDEDGWDLVEVVQGARRHARALVAWPLVVGLIAYGIAFMLPPTYVSSTTFMPPQQQQSIAGSALASVGALAGLGITGVQKSPADQYAALMQSATVADRIIARFKLMDVYDVPYKEDARKIFAERVRVTVGKKDGLVAAEVEDHDRQRAADIANALVEELRRMTDVLAVSEAQQRRVFFERQLKQTKDNLAVAQQAMESSGLSQGTLKSDARTAAETYARLKAEVTSAEVRLQSMRSFLSENAAEYRQAQMSLSALQGQLARVEEPASSRGAADYISKFREFKYQETLFDLFARQYELARVDESREGGLVQVVDLAQPAERRSKPRRTVIAACAALAGLIAVIAFLWARRTWRETLERRGDTGTLSAPAVQDGPANLHHTPK